MFEIYAVVWQFGSLAGQTEPIVLTIPRCKIFHEKLTTQQKSMFEIYTAVWQVKLNLLYLLYLDLKYFTKN